MCFIVTSLHALSHMMSCIIYNHMPVQQVIPFHVILQQLGITVGILMLHVYCTGPKLNKISAHKTHNDKNKYQGSTSPGNIMMYVCMYEALQISTCELRNKMTNYFSWNQMNRTFGHNCHMTWALIRNTITLHKFNLMLDRVTLVPGNNKVRLKMSTPDVEPTSENRYYSWRIVITFLAIVDYACSSIVCNCCLCMHRGS